VINGFYESVAVSVDKAAVDTSIIQMIKQWVRGEEKLPHAAKSFIQL
jgi:hypothetical protein